MPIQNLNHQKGLRKDHVVLLASYNLMVLYVM